MVDIRDAVESDMGAVVEIYNASIFTTTTWSDRPQSLAERREWLGQRRARGDGVLVAIDRDVIVGFAAYGDFRDTALWPGYQFTIENTLHVREGLWGRGIGRALMEHLIDHARAGGNHVMVAAVDAENVGSIAFHRALGFDEVGRLREVGHKFDRWLDLVLMQRIL